jgi:hypothetical protein
MSSDNQLCKHMSKLTVFGSSDKHILSTQLFSTATITVLTVGIFASRLPVHLLVMGRKIKSINR